MMTNAVQAYADTVALASRPYANQAVFQRIPKEDIRLIRKMYLEKLEAERLQNTLLGRFGALLRRAG